MTRTDQACCQREPDGKPTDRRCFCRRCASREHVVEVVGITEPASAPITDAVEVLAQRSPGKIRSWLRDNSDVANMIRTVQAEQRQFQHSDLDTIQRPGIARNLRREFIAVGLLEDRHHGLDLFDTWTATFLDEVEHDQDRQTLRAYIRWSQRRRLEFAIEVGTIKAGSFRGARRFIRAADRFLQSTRDSIGELAACDQRHVDRWFANGNTNALSAISFLTWARQQRIIDSAIVLPVPHPPAAVGMTTDQRIGVIRHLLTTGELSAGDRFAGLLVAVYAQPVTRISRIRRDDIDLTRRPATARFGQQAIELDDHVAAVCACHLVDRDNASEWLFPGRTAGQPVSSHGLAERLRPHGATKAARVSALHDLTRQIPSTILADLIGYNASVIANRADTLGEPWQHYAAIKGRSQQQAQDAHRPFAR